MAISARRGTYWIGVAVLVAWSFGCTSSASSGASYPIDDNGDGAQCTPDPAPIDPACVLCEPTVNAPEISGSLVVAGEQALPSATGGNPVGVWIGRDVTVQIPAEAGGFVDVSGSSFQGSGWIAFNGDGTFEFLIEGEATVLLTGSSTPIVKGTSGGAKGTYSVAGSALGFSPECQFSSDPEVTEGGGIRLDQNPFSVSGSTMTLQAQMSVSGISVDVVLVLDAA